MNEHTNNTNAAYMEVTSRKVEDQDKKIAALEEKIKDMSGNIELIPQLLTAAEQLHSDLKGISLALEKMQGLSTQLELVTTLLKYPISNKVLHHHHIPKLIWISVGLFIAFSCVCSGWYMTSSKLDGYIANDTKYRKMRLDTGAISLQFYMDKIDSQYKSNPDLRKIVREMEEEKGRNIERMKKVARLKEEARELERKVKK